MYRKALIGTAVVIASLAAAIGIVYTFGTPQAPSTSTNYTPASGLEADARTGVAPQQGGSPMGKTVTEVPAGGVPEPDENVPLAIQIPGCTCHSDDPKIVDEHSKYRMNQCAGCHGGQTPTGK